MPEPRTQRERDIYLQGYEDAEKAYGKCHFCYGKGYSTQMHIVRPCACDRGKQIKELWGRQKQT